MRRVNRMRSIYACRDWRMRAPSGACGVARLLFVNIHCWTECMAEIAGFCLFNNLYFVVHSPLKGGITAIFDDADGVQCATCTGGKSTKNTLDDLPHSVSACSKRVFQAVCAVCPALVRFHRTASFRCAWITRLLST
eukprot:IDg10958t1